LKVINSTFAGVAFAAENIESSSIGSAEIVNSTLFFANLSGKFNLSNSILREVNCAGTVKDALYNLRYLTSGCPGSIPVMNPQFVKDGFLQANSGPTLTFALLPTSPAVDAIPLGNCIDQDNKPVATDQRGFVRPWPAAGRCDIGAFESGSH